MSFSKAFPIDLNIRRGHWQAMIYSKASASLAACSFTRCLLTCSSPISKRSRVDGTTISSDDSMASDKRVNGLLPGSKAANT